LSAEKLTEHLLGVVLEPPGGLASAEVLEPEGPGQGEVSVRREHQVGDEVTHDNDHFHSFLKLLEVRKILIVISIEYWKLDRCCL